MTQNVIDIGAVPDDGQGDPLRTAFAFTNDNFSQIFESGPVGSNVKIANNTITTTVINSNLILSPSGIGKIQVNNTLLPRIDNVYDLGSLSQRFNTIYVGSGGLDITGGIVVSGNITADYFIGNGSALTGIVATTGSRVVNGNSNINIPAAGSNIFVTVNGTGNIVVFSNTGAYVAGAVSATGNITGNYILGNGALLTGINANYSNANVAAYLPTYTGNLVSLTGPVTTTANVTGANLRTSGQITATGNITAGNVDATKVNAVTVAASGSISATGNITGNNLIGVTVTGTTVTATANVVGGNITTAGQISSTGNITGGNLSVPGGSVSSLTVSAAGNIRGGNLVTPGFITATGNITGGNVDTGNIHAGNVNVDSIVSAQGNVYGDTFVGNGLSVSGNVSAGNIAISGTFGATTLSASGNVIGGNLLTTGQVSATGNIAGNYFVGNGALLTGITVSAGSSLLNGNSNVVVATNGNVTVGVSGISNIAQFANTGAYVTGVISATGNITGSYLLGNGAFITGLPAGYSNADVANYLPTYSGNLPNLTGLVSTTGNIAGNYFIGNGSLLTGVTASGVNANALTGNTLSSNVLNSSLTSVGTLGNLSVAGNTISGNLSTGGLISATGNITGSNLLTAGLISATANVIGGNVITSGIISATGNATVDNLSTAGLITATGNISGNNIFATGLASVTGNVVAGNVNTSAIRPTSGELTITTASGNLNLQPTGNIVLANTYINSVAYPAQDTDAATKLYVDNMVSTAIAYHTPVYAATTTTLASSTGGTITYAQPNGVANGVGATLTTTGSFNLIDTSNVQTLGTRILVKDQADAVQNGIYTWANATAIVRATDADEYGPDSSQQISLNDYFFTSTGNVNVGAAFIVNSPPGTITFGTSNITFALFSQTTTYTANVDAGLSLTGTVFSAKVDLDTTAFDAGGNIIVKAGANLTTPNIGAATGTSLSLVGNVNSGNVNTSGLISATGNITGGNVLTAGLISATGNATLGNVLTGGLVSATANVTAGNLVTGGLITATGNIIVGNVGTAGLISAAGNIQGGNFLTGGLVSATGNATLGNILTSGLISSTGNITSTANILGGNVLTGGLVSVAGNITGGNILSNNYYYANGTPVPPGIVYTANTAPPVSPAPKVTDQWYDTANDVLYQYLDDGTSDYWIDTTSPAFAGGVVANVAISGTLVPVANVTYDIGTSTVYFHSTYTQNLYTNNRLPAYNMPLGAVVQTVMSSSLGGSITNSTSYADISYANVTITPSSATSKVFVMATGTTSFTSLAGQDVTADAQLVRSPSTSLQIQTCGTTVSGGGIGVTGSVSYSYVDTPGTTSPVTYKLQQKVSNASSTLTSTNIWLIAMEITAS